MILMPASIILSKKVEFLAWDSTFFFGTFLSIVLFCFWSNFQHKSTPTGHMDGQ